MTWGVREGELSCSVGEGEFFRFNLLCSFRFHRDFISFHKAVHSLTIILVIFFYSHSNNSFLFDEETFFSQRTERNYVALCAFASWNVSTAMAESYCKYFVPPHFSRSITTLADGMSRAIRLETACRHWQTRPTGVHLQTLADTTNRCVHTDTGRREQPVCAHRHWQTRTTGVHLQTLADTTN